MMDMIDVILIALFVEAIVDALKPLWTGGEKKMSVSELVAMGIGILLAVTCKIDMLAYVTDISYPFPPWVQYVFYALTGVAIGRGTGFLYDLWEKLREGRGGELIANGFEAVSGEAKIDLEITHWPMQQLKDFCELNGIEAEWCVDREDYIEAIEQTFSREETEPPEDGGAAE